MTLFVDTALGEYAQSLIKLDTKEDEVFRLVLDNEKLKNLIIELNTDKQLRDQSIDSLGRALFNRLTQRSTYAAGDPLGRGGEPYEVYRTGDFYGTFRVQIKSGDIEIDADPFKPDNNLFEMYTPDILGLTDESLQELIDESLHEFRKWYWKNLG